MEQVVQSLKTGETYPVEVPAPAVRRRGILVRTRASLVSAGTERMVVDFASKNLLQKAKARPDLVRQVFDKAQTEGILTTIESVRNRIDQPMPLGYSSAGVVIAVGSEATDFQKSDHVACAGGGYAAHAELVSVPRNLAVKIPSAVSFDSASFGTVGAIAMQGVRQADVMLGHNVAVIGLGLLGQLTAQLLQAAGCRVFGIDLNPGRVSLALKLGVSAASTNDVAPANAQLFTSGRGFDAVLITADTASNEPVQLAGELARGRAVIVAVGAIGMDIPRKLFYEKELSLRLSRSYGPGRYDTSYEEGGHDYPYEYVRWTEQRNIDAFLQLVAQNKIDVQSLITHRFPIQDAGKAYDLITGKTGEPFLGVVLTYPEIVEPNERVELRPTARIERTTQSDQVRLGLIGAGNFANATLLPAIKKLDAVEFVGIASAGGLSARSAGDRFGFSYCTTDLDKIYADPGINTLAILTRHGQHARLVTAALAAGKHVYVEKPLCLRSDELESIIAAYGQQTPRTALLVGFNRRFAPFIVALKEELEHVQEPLILNYRVNAGFIPRQHWVHDPAEGGGRLLGEGCHFIDLLLHLAGSVPSEVLTRALPDNGRYSADNFVITLEFANGSIGTITYAANGDKGFPKEVLEVFGGGLAARLDNYRSLLIRRGGKKIERMARLRQDKGYADEWRAFIAHIQGRGPAPISFDEIVRSTETTLAAHRSLLERERILLAHATAGAGSNL
jgi:predicted dehydrogenase/threonine dehydrogenase-like Zn-dependent dehydrogenase